MNPTSQPVAAGYAEALSELEGILSNLERADVDVDVLAAQVQRATQLAAAYKIDGVPTFGIGGKFITSPSMAGSNGNSLKILDTLIDRVRKGA